jgi:hypothetical protein
MLLSSENTRSNHPGLLLKLLPQDQWCFSYNWWLKKNESTGYSFFFFILWVSKLQ